MTDTTAINLERFAANMPTEPREATIKLIDALREYVRANDDMGRDLLDEGQITLVQLNQWRDGPDRASFTNMLASLEEQELNENLNGLLA